MANYRLSAYRSVSKVPRAVEWLSLLENYGRAPNTLCAYAQALEGFFRFLNHLKVAHRNTTPHDISLLVRWMQGRYPKLRSPRSNGYSNSTILQWLSAVRLFFEYLVEEGEVKINPVRAGSRRRGRSGRPALVRQTKALPWIPTQGDWTKILKAFQGLHPRDQLMVAFAYDAALRREELCSIRISDIDLGNGLLRIPAEHSKSRTDRIVPLSAPTRRMCAAYYTFRKTQSSRDGALFLSLSPRNRHSAIGLSTWTKIVERVREECDLPRLTTHSFRHLRLTDLARSNWGVQKIAQFAGHTSIASTMRYIHLSGRDISDKVQRATGKMRLEALSNASSAKR